MDPDFELARKLQEEELKRGVINICLLSLHFFEFNILLLFITDTRRSNNFKQRKLSTCTCIEQYAKFGPSWMGNDWSHTKYSHTQESIWWKVFPGKIGPSWARMVKTDVQMCGNLLSTFQSIWAQILYNTFEWASAQVKIEKGFGWDVVSK